MNQNGFRSNNISFLFGYNIVGVLPTLGALSPEIAGFLTPGYPMLPDPLGLTNISFDKLLSQLAPIAHIVREDWQPCDEIIRETYANHHVITQGWAHEPFWYVVLIDEHPSYSASWLSSLKQS